MIRNEEGGLRALSIRQPWLDFILYCGKDIECRSWFSHYEGPILLHQSKTLDDFKDVMGFLLLHVPITAAVREVLMHWYYVYEAPEACLLATANIESAIDVQESEWAIEGHYAWRLSDVVVLAEPVPYYGVPRFFPVNGELHDDVDGEGNPVKRLEVIE